MVKISLYFWDGSVSFGLGWVINGGKKNIVEWNYYSDKYITKENISITRGISFV